jgi:hypothetical protein
MYCSRLVIPISCAVLAALSCSSDKSDAPGAPGAVPEVAGSWYATDLHVHSAEGSNDAGEESTVERIAEVARSRDFSLIAITDHSNSAGSMDCGTDEVEDCPNQGPEFPSRDAALAASGDGLAIVTGVEISPVASLEATMEPRGHVGCLPLPDEALSEAATAVTDRPAGDVSGGAGVGWCQDQGGLAIINHPVTIAGWLAYDWTSDGYDGLELFNGSARFDEGDARSVDAWMCDIGSGRAVIPVGGSDCHVAGLDTPPEGLFEQALGFPTTWVRAESDDRTALLTALASGHVVIGDPRTSLEMVVHDGKQAVSAGQTLSTGASQVEIQLTAVTGAGEMMLQLVEVTEDTCTLDTRFEDGEAPTADPIIHVSTALEVGLQSTMSMSLTVGDGRIVYARVWPAAEMIVFEDGVALTNVVRVMPDQ